MFIKARKKVTQREKGQKKVRVKVRSFLGVEKVMERVIVKGGHF